ncbi:MAG: hypothetical protein P8H03_08085 [Emcibacteraceae bacterium]|nr:hypothetical protein [Emcibacteraceae bacterium]
MSGIDLSRISVLVVEDSPFIRTLLVNSIRILGYKRFVLLMTVLKQLIF